MSKPPKDSDFELTILDPARGRRQAASLYDEVLTKLRDYIVEGNLEGGARVPERKLCALFGISRTPLREALKVLASEGLIELLPNRGARVRQLSAQELREVFDIIGGLEALAGRLACENITDAQIAEVAHLHHEMYGYFIRRDLHKYFEYNQMIHQKILQASQSATLIAAYAGFGGKIRRMRYSANLAPSMDRWSESMREHEAILDALQRRAGAELSNILFAHLRNKHIAAEDYLRKEEPAAAAS